MSTRPIIGFPDWSNIEDQPFIVYSDASIDGFGVVITQMQQDETGKMMEKIILYDSRRTSKAERNYDANRLELACFLWICEAHKHLLYPSKFKWFTDNISMKAIKTMKPPRSITRRWLSTINAYNFEVYHNKRKKYFL